MASHHCLSQALARSLNHNFTLTSLELEDNQIGEDGLNALYVALRCNSVIQRLSAGDNPGPQHLIDAIGTGIYDENYRAMGPPEFSILMLRAVGTVGAPDASGFSLSVE